MNKLIFILLLFLAHTVCAKELDSTSVLNHLGFNPAIRSVAIEGSTIYLFNAYSALIDIDLIKSPNKHFSKYGLRMTIQQVTQGFVPGIDARLNDPVLRLIEYFLRASSEDKYFRFDLCLGYCYAKSYDSKFNSSQMFIGDVDFRWIILRPMLNVFLRVNIINYVFVPSIGLSIGYID